MNRGFGAALAVYAVVLSALPLVLSETTFEHFLSEEGPIEIASAYLWLVAAIVVLVCVRPLRARTWALALLYVVFAAREADLHKAFTADSLFKTAYYRRVAAPFEEKLIAFIVAIAIIALLVYVLWAMIRFLWIERGWRTRAGAWLLVGVLLLFFTKVLDRAPATLAEDFDIVISPLVHRYFSVFEEGLEALMPLVFAFSAWVSRGERHYL